MPELAETRPIPALSDPVPGGNGQRDPAAGNGPEPANSGQDADGEPEPRPRLAKDASPASNRRSFWIELPVLIVVALVLALIIKTYAIQAFFIPSGSMQNTLAIGDRVLINKLVYDWGSPGRGDIVVFNGDGSWDTVPPPGPSNIFSKLLRDIEDIGGASAEGDVYIKRVIGLPGDHVVCCNAKGQITVNGVALSEGSYLYPGNQPSESRFNVTVPAGRLWVMGDHRDISYDSRGHMGRPGGGTIPEDKVMGKAFVIVWPASRWGLLGVPATFRQPGFAKAAAAAAPAALGFAGAVPLTIAQAALRRRYGRRRPARRRTAGRRQR